MAKRISQKIVEKIKLLRQRGFSLPEIAKVVPTGYGTIYRYIKGIEVLPQYRTVWLGKRGGSKKRKKIAEKKALDEAKRTIENVSLKELTIFLSALYWGEGSKADFGITNSDPELIRVFILGLRRLFNIQNDRLRISIRLYEDLDRDACLRFWAEITGVSLDQFVSVDMLHGRKAGKLRYGMCRVRVRKGGDLLKYLLAVKSVVLERVGSP